MIHLTLSNPCSLPSQSYRQKSGVGGAGLPYALWITATLVRDKLREGTLALLTKSASLGNRHSCHHSVARGLWPEKKGVT